MIIKKIVRKVANLLSKTQLMKIIKKISFYYIQQVTKYNISQQITVLGVWNFLPKMQLMKIIKKISLYYIHKLNICHFGIYFSSLFIFYKKLQYKNVMLFSIRYLRIHQTVNLIQAGISLGMIIWGFVGVAVISFYTVGSLIPENSSETNNVSISDTSSSEEDTSKFSDIPYADWVQRLTGEVDLRGTSQVSISETPAVEGTESTVKRFEVVTSEIQAQVEQVAERAPVAEIASVAEVLRPVYVREVNLAERGLVIEKAEDVMKTALGFRENMPNENSIRLPRPSEDAEVTFVSRDGSKLVITEKNDVYDCHAVTPRGSQVTDPEIVEGMMLREYVAMEYFIEAVDLSNLTKGLAETGVPDAVERIDRTSQQ